MTSDNNYKCPSISPGHFSFICILITEFASRMPLKTVFSRCKASDPQGSRAVVFNGQLYTNNKSMVLKANQQEQENHRILKPTPWLYLLDGACNLTVQLQQLHGWQLPCLAVTVSMSDLCAPSTLLAPAVLSIQFPEFSQ